MTWHHKYYDDEGEDAEAYKKFMRQYNALYGNKNFTFYHFGINWDNLLKWKQDGLLMMIEPVFEEALESDDLRIKVDVAKFVATNLDNKTDKKTQNIEMDYLYPIFRPGAVIQINRS